MMQTKSPFKSNTIWGGTITVLIAMIGIWLVDTPNGVVLAVVTTKKIVESLGLIGSWGYLVWGRFNADTKITLRKDP